MKNLAWLLALVAVFPSENANAADQILTFTSLGAVRIGMTQAQVEATLRTKLKPVYPDMPKSCWFGNRADGVDGPVSYWIENGKVVAIDIDDHEWPKAGTSVPPVATDHGIHIGASTAAVKEAYKAIAIIDEHYSDIDYISLLSPDKQYGIAFNVTTGAVNHIRAGTAKNFKDSEPCI